MKHLRCILASAMMLLCAPALAQVNPGTSPLTGPKGGTNNAFMQFTGPSGSLKTYTVPNVSGTLGMLSQIQTWTGQQTFVAPILGVATATSVQAGSLDVIPSVTNKLEATSSSAATGLFAGQDTTHFVALNWVFNATPANASAQIATNSFTNPITIDASDVAIQGASGGTLHLLGKSFSLGGNFAMSGAFGFTGTLTGTTAVTFPTSGTLVAQGGPLGTPSSGTLTNTTGFPVSQLANVGAGVAAALGVSTGTAGSFVVNGGVLGTPSSGTLTNETGLPISTGLTGAGTGVLTALGTNVGSAGAFVTNGGALGTPSSGNGANLTGVITTCGSVSTGTCAMPYFAAYASTSTTVTSSTPTKVSINTKVSDSNSWFDAVTNFRFTPLLAGRYLVHVQTNCSGTTVTTCVAQIQKNSANYAQFQVNGSATTLPATAIAIVTFNGSTDFVEAFINNICSGTCQYTGGSGPIQTFFEAHFIGP